MRAKCGTHMKRLFLSISVAAGLLLAVTPNLWALPPRQHLVSGVVGAIDCASRTITLKSKGGAARVTFVWNDSTRFTRKGGCAECSLASGQTVRGWYRREVGRNVLSEVSTKGASVGCGPMCK